MTPVADVLTPPPPLLYLGHFILDPGAEIFLSLIKGQKDLSSVADPDLNPDPPDPHVFGPPRSGSGSISQRYGSESPDPDLVPSITKEKKNEKP